MTTWQRVRQSSNLEYGRVKNFQVLNYGPGYGCNAPLIFLSEQTTSSKILGSEKIVCDMVSRPYVPGRLQTQYPFEVRSRESYCSSGNVRRTVDTAWWCNYKPQTLQESTGAIMSMCAQPVEEIQTATQWDAVRLERALQRAMAKLTEPSVDMAVNLAEVGQTIKMIRRPLSAVGDGLKRILRPPRKTGSTAKRKRSLTSEAKKLPQYIADRWLEARYGLMPAIIDVNEGIKMYNAGIGRILRAYDRHAAVEVERKCTSTVSQASYWVYPFMLQHDTEFTTRARATVYFERERGPVWDSFHIATQLGLNPLYAASTVYELIPFSFVLDWAFDVGTWLKATSPHVGLSILGVTLSIKRESHYTCQTRSQDGFSHTSSIFHHKTARYLRNIGVPPVGFYPTLRNPFSKVNHMLDALALGWNNVVPLLNKHKHMRG